MNARTHLATAFLAIACMTLPATPDALAATNDSEIDELRTQLMALAERLDTLEQSNQQLRAANDELRQASQSNAAAAAQATETADLAVARVEEAGSASSWADKISWAGDFRYRYENIDIEGVDDRNRNRIRARAALTARISDDLKVGLGVATGGTDPVSANQTLGGGGSTKDIGLDLAYFDWSGLENTHIIGGKFKNILQPAGKNSMLWDSDWRPEGVAFTWQGDLFYAGGIGTWLEGDSRRSTQFAWLAEAGVRLNMGDKVKMRFGISYHEIDAKGRASVFGDDDFFGNSSVEILGQSVYRYDYHGLEVQGEIGFELFDLPVLAFGDYVKNQEAGEFDTGYVFGLKVGSAKAKGTWDLSWAWEDLEADAALGLLVDSDFGGGGTDARGHIFKGKYALKKNVTAGFTYFINEIDGDLGTERDFNRLMVDFAFKY